MKPIRPEELEGKWIGGFDPLIIEAVNQLLVENYSPLKKDIRINQNEIISRYMKLSTIIEQDTINEKKKDLFLKHQLDIEPVYEKEGWKVGYDKPGWDENYEPFFVFTLNSKRDA